MITEKNDTFIRPGDTRKIHRYTFKAESKDISSGCTKCYASGKEDMCSEFGWGCGISEIVWVLID